MHDGQVTVFDQMNVELDAVAVFQCGTESGHAVLTLFSIMQTPVGIFPALQPGKLRMTGTALCGQHIESAQCYSTGKCALDNFIHVLYSSPAKVF